LTLIGFRAALFAAVVSTALEVDIRAADRWNKRCGCDSPRADCGRTAASHDRDVELDRGVTSLTHALRQSRYRKAQGLVDRQFGRINQRRGKDGKKWESEKPLR
jgi:hypothetical protein